MNIAIFGGTFDPPHVGHCVIAEEAKQSCGLDRVIFLPCHQSPHKTSLPQASDQDRLAMLQLCTADLPWAEVSDWELQKPKPSFSFETAEHFRATFPRANLFWLMGVDQWLALERWSKPDRLAELLTFIVFPRDNISPSRNPKFRSVFLNREIKVSATAIRGRVHAQESVVELVHPEVNRYIQSRALYH